MDDFSYLFVLALPPPLHIFVIPCKSFFYACSRFLRMLLGRQRTLEHTGLLFNYRLETVIIFDKRLGWRVVEKCEPICSEPGRDQERIQEDDFLANTIY